MEMQIESKHFDAGSSLKESIGDMFNDLDKYNDQIVGMDIYLEELNISEQDNKKVKVNVSLPGADIFVEEKDTDFISAAQKTHDTLKRQLADRKDMDKSYR